MKYHHSLTALYKCNYKQWMVDPSHHFEKSMKVHWLLPKPYLLFGGCQTLNILQVNTSQAMQSAQKISGWLSFENLQIQSDCYQTASSSYLLFGGCHMLHIFTLNRHEPKLYAHKIPNALAFENLLLQADCYQISTTPYLQFKCCRRLHILTVDRHKPTLYACEISDRLSFEMYKYRTIATRLRPRHISRLKVVGRVIF